MTAIAKLLEQRSTGDVTISVTRDGVSVLREAGSAKVRLPRGSHEAILINTSGGLAGGDKVGIDAHAADHAKLTLTSQAAERVYRTLGPAACVNTTLKVDHHARLHWLPQEMILFDGAALSRNFTVDLAEGAHFLAAEAIVLGRKEMGETVSSCELNDRWQIRRNGRLLHADTMRLSGKPPASTATLGQAGAFATIILVADDAERSLVAARQVIAENGGVSCWNGKLVARLLARDGFTLRKSLIPLLSVLAGPEGLPKVWSL